MEKNKNPLFKETDAEVLAKVVSGEISRNKNYDFFSSTRGKNLFKKAKIIQGLLKDLEDGSVVIEKNESEEVTELVIENQAKSYKRTLFLDNAMFEVYKNATKP